MRPEAAAADRAREVLRAAKGWHEAGLLDDAGLARLEREYPDDRARLGPAFRILFFLFTLVAGSSMLGFFFALLGLFRHMEPDAVGWVLLLGGVAFTIATEVQQGPLKRREGGSEEATALLAAGCLLGGAGILIDRFFSGPDEATIGIPLFFAIGAALGIAAAVRWGAWILGLLGVASGYLLVARVPHGRWAWFVVGLALAVPFFRAASSARHSPADRLFFEASGAASLLAAYLAINVWSMDDRFLEFLRSFSRPTAAAHPAERALAIAGTALLPVILVAVGIRARQRTVLLAGALFGVLSLVTLRHYVHLAPLWVILGGAGAASVAIALGLRRWLASGADGERGGFTPEPLLGTIDRRRQAAEMAAVAIAMAPDARSLPVEKSEPTTFDGGGGRSGGGGATGGY